MNVLRWLKYFEPIPSGNITHSILHQCDVDVDAVPMYRAMDMEIVGMTRTTVQTRLRDLLGGYRAGYLFQLTAQGQFPRQQTATTCGRYLLGRNNDT